MEEVGCHAWTSDRAVGFLRRPASAEGQQNQEKAPYGEVRLLPPNFCVHEGGDIAIHAQGVGRIPQTIVVPSPEGRLVGGTLLGSGSGMASVADPSRQCFV